MREPIFFVCNQIAFVSQVMTVDLAYASATAMTDSARASRRTVSYAF